MATSGVEMTVPVAPAAPAEAGADATVESKSVPRSDGLENLKTPIDVDADSIDKASPDSDYKVVASSDTKPGDKMSPANDDAVTKDPEVNAKLDTDIAEITVETEQLSKVISYNQHADLYLLIRDPKGDALYYKVCSALVAAASPGLSNLVEFQKPKVSTNNKFFLDLGDFGGHSHGLDIVMSILHHKFKEMPTRPDVEQLHSIARVVEEYDCAHLLVPYMEAWMKGLEWHMVMKTDTNDDDKALFLAWVFGEARWFARMLIKAAHNATLDDNGVLLDSHGRPWENQGVPKLIIDLISKTRYDCLVKIVRAVDEPLRQLLAGKKDFCRSKDPLAEMKQSCQHQQLGSLMSALSAAGLLPFPTADAYSGSVAALAEKVMSIKVVRFKMPNTPAHLDTHGNCGINHEEAVEAALREGAHITGDVLQQLELRAHKSGAYIPEVFKALKGPEGQDTDSDSPREDLLLNWVHFKQVLEEYVGNELVKEVRQRSLRPELSMARMGNCCDVFDG